MLRPEASHSAARPHRGALLRAAGPAAAVHAGFSDSAGRLDRVRPLARRSRGIAPQPAQRIRCSNSCLGAPAAARKRSHGRGRTMAGSASRDASAAGAVQRVGRPLGPFFLGADSGRASAHRLVEACDLAARRRLEPCPAHGSGWAIERQSHESSAARNRRRSAAACEARFGSPRASKASGKGIRFPKLPSINLR